MLKFTYLNLLFRLKLGVKLCKIGIVLCLGKFGLELFLNLQIIYSNERGGVKVIRVNIELMEGLMKDKLIN